MIYRVSYPNGSFQERSCAFSTTFPDINLQCQSPGFFIDQAVAFLRIFDPEAQVKFLPNGNLMDSIQAPDYWAVMSNMLLTNLADLSPPMMTLTDDRAEKLAYTTPLSHHPLLFAYRDEQNTEPSLSLGTFISAKKIGAVLCVLLFWTIFKKLLFKTETLLPNGVQFVLRKVRSSSQMLIFMAYGIFLGCLSSYVVILFNKQIPVQPPFKDAIELAKLLETNRFRIIYQFPVVLNQVMGYSSSRSAISRNFEAAFKKNPPLFIEDGQTGVIGKLFSKETRYVYVTDDNYELMALLSSSCGLNYVTDTFLSPTWFVSYLGPELARRFSYGSVKRGVFHKESEKLAAKYFPPKKCPWPERKYFVISLYQVAIAFYLILGSLATSVLLLISENVVATFIRRWDLL